MMKFKYYAENIKKNKESIILKLLLIFVLLWVLGVMATPKDYRTHIKFSTWGSQSEIDILTPLLKEFEKENPDICVDLQHIPQNYFQKLHLLFASNTPPDVLFINNQNLPYYADAKVLEPFNRKIYNINFSKKALDSLSYKGALYAIPRDISTLVIFYNDSLFKMYDVRRPTANWTMDDLLAKAICLTKDLNGDGKTDIWGMSFEEDPPMFYLPFLMSKGGGFLADDGKTMIIDSIDSQQGLEYYSNLRNLYHVAPTKYESASATMSQMFLQGKLAMIISGRWMVPKFKSDAKFNWNVINFPAGAKGSVVPLDSSGWAIAKASEHKAEAKKLVDFLSSKPSIMKFTSSGLIVPARIDVQNSTFVDLDKSVGLNGTKLNNQVFIDTIRNSKVTPVSTDYNVVLDMVKKKTNYIFNSSL